MDILTAAVKHATRKALIVGAAKYSFQELLRSASGVARRLEQLQGRHRGKWGPRVGLYLRPSVEYVAATWGTWLAGGIAVPLALSHFPSEVEHILTHQELCTQLPSLPGTRIEALHLTQCETEHEEKDAQGLFGEGQKLPALEDGALLLYTSGTTGRPKGVLHTHRSIQAQMESLSEAWEWSEGDVILHALPLHHIHGIMNALYTAHRNGACVQLLPKFSPSHVWSAFQEGGISLFMGVPTMYSHLLSYYHEQSIDDRQRMMAAAETLRLFVSGSAACPVSIMRQWKEVTHHWLLERYGTTETGMALSNPLHGERRPGYVGQPLPGVSVKVVPSHESSGELYVKGEALFTEYWGNESATFSAFDSDGYFKTGDIVSVSLSPPTFRILGRQSVDIIKSGGYKLSALEIESAILEHPAIAECTVVGLPDLTYSEIVTAVICVKGAEVISQEELLKYCQSRLAKYKIPRRVVQLDRIPRNAMGKVNKKQIKQLILKL